jgi:hypothetical protein
LLATSKHQPQLQSEELTSANCVMQSKLNAQCANATMHKLLLLLLLLLLLQHTTHAMRCT